ncbi:MAG: hypothetical protein HQK65_14015, partial [Desulfamplus sp.]|nr:hypothetical protein [Desulfamplus sp.]
MKSNSKIAKNTVGLLVAVFIILGYVLLPNTVESTCQSLNLRNPSPFKLEKIGAKIEITGNDNNFFINFDDKPSEKYAALQFTADNEQGFNIDNNSTISVEFQRPIKDEWILILKDKDKDNRFTEIVRYPLGPKFQNGSFQFIHDNIMVRQIILQLPWNEKRGEAVLRRIDFCKGDIAETESLLKSRIENLIGNRFTKEYKLQDEINRIS